MIMCILFHPAEHHKENKPLFNVISIVPHTGTPLKYNGQTKETSKVAVRESLSIVYNSPSAKPFTAGPRLM